MALSDNIWWTRKARIRAERRLLANEFQAQLLLLWYSFCSVSASIYYLALGHESKHSSIAWVIFSVLTLAVSGFINGLGYKERAALFKDSYETLNGLYSRTKSAIENKQSLDNFTKEYEQILGICENHKEIDYFISLCEAHLSPNTGLDRSPTKYVWFIVLSYYAKRSTYLLAFYALPVAIFYILEQCHGN